MLLRRLVNCQLQQYRGAVRPPSNIPYAGIYRKDGERVRKNDLLVVQRKLNYHPGANVRFLIRFTSTTDNDILQVYHLFDRGQHLLKSDCDGKVMITREPVEPDMSNEFVEREYARRPTEGLFKFHFNIVPTPMSQTFKLVDQV